MSDPPPTDAPLAKTSRSRSWLWPAVVVIAVLAVPIAAGRLGQTPGELSASPRAAAATRTAAGVIGTTPRASSPRASLSIRHRPVYAEGARLLGTPIGIRTDSDRFDDGILAEIGGDPVVRVRDAAALPVGSVALVGGWLRRALCPSGEGSNPCLALLSDVPYRSPREAVVALGGRALFDYSQGPRVYRASVQNDPSCTFTAFEQCLPRLIVGQPVWQGDEQTMTEPIDGSELLGALASRFPAADIHPFTEASSCPVQWPVQSYLFSDPRLPRALWEGVDVRVVALFLTTAERVQFEPELRRSAAQLTSFDASNRCVAVAGGVDDSDWIVRDNAMVLLGTDDPVVRAAVDDILASRAT